MLRRALRSVMQLATERKARPQHDSSVHDCETSRIEYVCKRLHEFFFFPFFQIRIQLYGTCERQSDRVFKKKKICDIVFNLDVYGFYSL